MLRYLLWLKMERFLKPKSYSPKVLKLMHVDDLMR